MVADFEANKKFFTLFSIPRQIIVVRVKKSSKAITDAPARTLNPPGLFRRKFL